MSSKRFNGLNFSATKTARSQLVRVKLPSGLVVRHGHYSRMNTSSGLSREHLANDDTHHSIWNRACCWSRHVDGANCPKCSRKERVRSAKMKKGALAQFEAFDIGMAGPEDAPKL